MEICCSIEISFIWNFYKACIMKKGLIFIHNFRTEFWQFGSVFGAVGMFNPATAVLILRLGAASIASLDKLP